VSAPKGKPLASLCILDFEARKCWTNKVMDQGFAFEDMGSWCEMDKRCWFALDENDLTRIQRGLNK
jgi:hypothetical protein